MARLASSAARISSTALALPSVAREIGTNRTMGRAGGARAARHDHRFVDAIGLHPRNNFLAAATRQEVGPIGKASILHDEARNEIVAVGTARCGSEDDRLDVKDQSVSPRPPDASNSRGINGLGHDVRIRLGLRFLPVAIAGSQAALLLEVGNRLGYLFHHGPEDREIGFDRVEPRTDPELGQIVDALAEDGAGLGIGRQQAGEVLDRLFESGLGAPAELALDQQHRKAAKKRWQ